MKAEELMKAIDGIDDSVIVDFAEENELKNLKAKRSFRWKALHIAAIFMAVTALGIYFMSQSWLNEPVTEPPMSSTVKEESVISVKIYAADNTERTLSIENEEPVQIMGSYNPLLSSGEGLGIPLKITYPEKKLTLQTVNGHFLTWNSKNGKVDDYGTTFTTDDELEIFWTPYKEDVYFNKSSVITITVTDDSKIYVRASVKISSDDEGKTFSARMDSYDVYPHGITAENNEIQTSEETSQSIPEDSQAVPYIY